MHFFNLLITFLFFNVILTIDYDQEWQNYKKTHSKIYSKKEQVRQSIFNSNLDRINEHNRQFSTGLHSFKMSVNKFSDMTFEEFEQKMMGFNKDFSKNFNFADKSFPLNFENSLLPQFLKKVDWRKKNVVTPVKDQKTCGSCWAFAAVAGLESHYALVTDKLVSLSEQNLVDCSTSEGNKGCNGGLMSFAYDYIIKNKGINTEKSYPYEAVDGKCRFDSYNIGATMRSYVVLKSNDEKLMAKVVTLKGPLVVAVHASSQWQFYSKGVFDWPDCKNNNESLNHGVTIVGYGIENKLPYWLIKNSWGTTWGEDGYIKLRRNVNMCGIALQPLFPVV